MSVLDAALSATSAQTQAQATGLVFLTDPRPVRVDVYALSTAWIHMPHERSAPVSPLPGLLKEIRDLTGWARRDLARVLGTTHPTIGRLETDGRVTARSRDVAARVAELHAVLVRLGRVAAGPPALILALQRQAGGITPLELLRQGEWAQAYTSALDALRGPRPAMLPAALAPVRAATRELRP